MIRGSQRVRWLLAATALALIGWVPVRAQAGPLTVEMTQTTLSVNADDVPLAEVLLAIGQRAKARILIESVLEDQVGKERVTTSFAGLAMDDGLRRLLKNRNFILGFGPSGVDEIRVYIDGGTGFRDLTAGPREAAVPTGPARPTGPVRRREPSEAPAEDRARLTQLRQTTLSSGDATARLEALEELSETQDTAYLLDAVVEALGRERDAKVLEGLLDVVQDRGPIPVAPLARRRSRSWSTMPARIPARARCSRRSRAATRASACERSRNRCSKAWRHLGLPAHRKPRLAGETRDVRRDARLGRRQQIDDSDRRVRGGERADAVTGPQDLNVLVIPPVRRRRCRRGVAPHFQRAVHEIQQPVFRTPRPRVETRLVAPVERGTAQRHFDDEHGIRRVHARVVEQITADDRHVRLWL